jgi:hypothetical protein
MREGARRHRGTPTGGDIVHNVFVDPASLGIKARGVRPVVGAPRHARAARYDHGRAEAEHPITGTAAGRGVSTRITEESIGWWSISIRRVWPSAGREQWRWQGRGPRYLKIGGRVVYRVSDIEAFEMSSIHANTLGAIDKGPEEKPGHGVC